MKTVFIINPYAGQKKDAKSIMASIEEAAKRADAEVEMYVTQSVGDAGKYVREYCLKNGAARFIACGGDGTLSEVLNGASEFEDAQIGVLPMGTGNDFCRNFAYCGDFKDISSLLSGSVTKCDAIRYKTFLRGEEKFGYCVNMFNIGFDCNVADLTSSMKKKPFISGSLAYFISIFVMLVKKKGARLKIELDSKTYHNGNLLLTSIANGSYCGGGVKSNPLASVTDGYISVNIVNNISRFKFIKLLPYYMKGTYMKLKNINKIITSTKCKKIKVTPLAGSMRLCIDGEITNAGVTEFEIVHNAFNFVVPWFEDGDSLKKETACV